MNFENLTNPDFLLKVLIALIVAALLPTLWPVIMAGVGLVLVLLLLDASQGGQTLNNLVDRITNWLKGQK